MSRAFVPPLLLLTFVVTFRASPAGAQSMVDQPVDQPSRNIAPSASPSVWPAVDFGATEQPAGAPATPRHTGIKAMLRGMFGDVKRLPSKENLYWAAAGGGLALAFHPLDAKVNEQISGNAVADNIFQPGRILGGVVPIVGSAGVYAFGRLKDQPKVSHLGMDLLRSQAVAQLITQTMKYSVRRERPDETTRNSFPSGHAATTFAVATVLERHLSWRYSVPAYAFASYVAASRLPIGRHWLSDVIFGAAVGIISGRTVTSDEANPFPVTVTQVPGGAAIVFSAWPRRRQSASTRGCSNGDSLRPVSRVSPRR